jgi:hypothetical protein
MLILKQGHPRDFSENDLVVCINKLEKLLGKLPEPTIKPDGSQRQNIPAVRLFNILHAIETAKLGITNKILHYLGYDGVVDYDGSMLPIESCQGVMTWPGALEFQVALKTPKQSKNPGYSSDRRLENILKGLKNYKNGSLRLSSEEIKQAAKMLPKFHSRWDISESRSDFYSLLMKKLDFNHSDAWEFVEWYEYGDRFYEELSFNPTTPQSFWEKLQYASDKNMKDIAKEKLANKF